MSCSTRLRSYPHWAPPAQLPAFSEPIGGCFRWRRVVVVVPILFIPLFFEVYVYVFIGLWFLLQVLQSMTALLLPAASGDVAWWAHVGGFIAGFGLGSLLVRSEQRYRVYYPDEGLLGFDTDGRL
jgi:membrane associated rhomboid family serine protease